MKEHMRHYFPDRFPEKSDLTGFVKSTIKLLDDFYDERRTRECEMKVINVLNKSDELKLLIGAMKKHGCNFDVSRHISCERCHGCHGGYDPDTNQIIICQNRVLTKNRLMSTIMHEMIHMFDVCRVKFDFDNLEHVACSEIRASNLTYCGIRDRITFGQHYTQFRGSHKFCVQDVAFRSVKGYSPETDDEKISEIVMKVFPYCYNDLEPFGRRPLNGPRDLKQSYRERYYYGYI